MSEKITSLAGLKKAVEELWDDEYSFKLAFKGSEVRELVVKVLAKIAELRAEVESELNNSKEILEQIKHGPIVEPSPMAFFKELPIEPEKIEKWVNILTGADWFAEWILEGAATGNDDKELEKRCEIAVKEVVEDSRKRRAKAAGGRGR